ncbi:hypothetical protein M378DRAFT_169949 [Amanita muscaria Koide BX008]|uniref:Uncharacterized protein n=1 Tax=Amanita muscaria (strain Koide BX008) TaxID=946122 RepID=A0A0C2S876_AMAMK|nr:hypothetical protein M378DRAFT_169949 [Amanita muscaria Koide BX008]
MAWSALLDFLCCCRCRKQVDDESRIDENTHLIPSVPDYDLYDATILHQRRLDERLGSIIRSKEGKMVNVSSHLPFNLHNRALPEESFSHSRSASSLRGRRWPSEERYPEDPYERRAYPRSPSQDSAFRETITRQPMFNIRLVSYEPPSRGRSPRPDAQQTREGEKSPGSGVVGSSEPATSAAALASESHDIQFEDIGILCTSWGDS